MQYNIFLAMGLNGSERSSHDGVFIASQGKIHNAAVAMSGSPSSTPSGVMSFTPEYWKFWRGASDPSLRSMGCCTDAYTGLVALPSTNTLVMTYDMLAFNCPRGVSSPNNVCDFILSMQLEVKTIKGANQQLSANESKPGRQQERHAGSSNSSGLT